jgi:DNA gyrase subunit A
VKNFEEEKYLVGVTKLGLIKKTAISEYNTNRTGGIIALKLKEGDQLIDIKQSTGEDNIIIVTRKGKCICFNEEDVRPMGRIASGVRAIKLDDDDEVVSMCLVHPGEELMVVTANGFGKRTPVKEYKLQVRGGKGLLTYDKSKFRKTGEIIGAMVVDEDDEIFLINSQGIIIRIRAGEVSELGRATQGVKIMKVEEDTKIVAMAKAIREEEVEENKETEQLEI